MGALFALGRLGRPTSRPKMRNARPGMDTKWPAVATIPSLLPPIRLAPGFWPSGWHGWFKGDLIAFAGLQLLAE
jgi:hypothetical protein